MCCFYLFQKGSATHTVYVHFFYNLDLFIRFVLNKLLPQINTKLKGKGGGKSIFKKGEIIKKQELSEDNEARLWGLI